MTGRNYIFIAQQSHPCHLNTSPIFGDGSSRLSGGQRANIAKVLHLLFHPAPLRRAVVRVERVQKHLEVASIVHAERALERKEGGRASGHGRKVEAGRNVFDKGLGTVKSASRSTLHSVFVRPL